MTRKAAQRLTGRFAGNVICHACDTVDFVDDPCRDFFEKRKVKVVGLLDVLVPEPRSNTGCWLLTSADMKSRVLTARRLESVSSGIVNAENENLHGDVSVYTGVALDADGWGLSVSVIFCRFPCLREPIWEAKNIPLSLLIAT
jgi:hypothetical protein